jgi:hypothetical protein
MGNSKIKRTIYGRIATGEIAEHFHAVAWVADTGEFSLGFQSMPRNLIVFNPSDISEMQADCLAELDDSERLLYVLGLVAGQPTHCDKCAEPDEMVKELRSYDVALDGSHFSHVCFDCAFELGY